MQSKQTVQVGLLTLVALGLLTAIFYTPTWWVSLTAPNYPTESFPDGVRIHFHMNGVFNGCQKQDKAEIQEDEALDCVHEMDTINHYVGMYPIAAGGPVERAFSQFLLVMLGVMLLGFMCTNPKLRMGIMGVGFAGIIGWMYMTIYIEGGFSLENGGYVEAMVTALDQDAGGDKSEEPEFVIGGIVGVLKNSLAESGVSVVLPSEMNKSEGGAAADKAELIEQLRITYDRDQQKQENPIAWSGSTFDVMTWHYAKSLGRYFNNQAEIIPMVANLKIAINVVFIGLIGAMALLIFGARKNSGLLFWLLVLVPIHSPSSLLSTTRLGCGGMGTP